ncbi:MAG: glycosyltransferase, partial [Clostridia bacterium]|nr:glycosyltransferase [Clostridia bacterium]
MVSGSSEFTCSRHFEGISDAFTFIGYRKNPYQYITHCDLFVCSSYREGFSTAATESLIVGTPV